MITIRKGEIKDLEQIIELNKLLFIKEQEDYDSLYDANWPLTDIGREYFIKELTETDRIIFVAEEAEKIIGYLAASAKRDSKFKNNALVAEVENMFISKQFQNQGIGSKLINMFLDWCKQINADRAIVIASFDNLKGIKFYKKHNFKEFEVGLKLDFKD